MPKTKGRRRYDGMVTPSIRFDDSTPWTMACSRAHARRTVRAGHYAASRKDTEKRQVRNHRIAMSENGGGTIGAGEAAMTIHILEKA